MDKNFSVLCADTYLSESCFHGGGGGGRGGLSPPKLAPDTMLGRYKISLCPHI